MTHYGDGSMLCKSPIFFTMKWFPQIWDSVIFWKYTSSSYRIHCKNCAFLHFDSSWGGGGGGSLWRKNKKNHFFKGCGEKMTITQLIIKLAPWNYVHSIENKILVKIKPKRDTRLQKKSSRARFFLQPWSKFPTFFSFFLLKWVKFLTFNI